MRATPEPECICRRPPHSPKLPPSPEMAEGPNPYARPPDFRASHSEALGDDPGAAPPGGGLKRTRSDAATTHLLPAAPLLLSEERQQRHVRRNRQYSDYYETPDLSWLPGG
jgi:hypothetical protein